MSAYRKDFDKTKYMSSLYVFIINLISKNETINLKQNADLTGKKWSIIRKVENCKLKTTYKSF